MTKRFTDNEIWTKDWFLNLEDKQKLLTKFIFDNCDCAGVYEISWRMLKIFFTSDITREDFEKIKQVRFLDDNTIFVEDFVNFQCSISSIKELNPNNNAHKGIIKRLKKYGLYLGADEGLIRGSIAPQEQEQEQETEKEKEKERDKEIECYGEHKNVILVKGDYNKLLAVTQSREMLNEVIEDLGTAIRTGKEQPYKDDLPYAHYERLRAFIKYRKEHPTQTGGTALDRKYAAIKACFSGGNNG